MNSASTAASERNESAYLLPPRRKVGPYSPRIQRRKKRAFLKAFAQTLSITKAAEMADIDRKTHYDWLHGDQQYAQEFEDIAERKIEHMETELFRRGTVGWDEPVYQGKEMVGTVRRFSDACLIFGLKAARPEVYRERFTVDAQHTHRVVSAEILDAILVNPESEQIAKALPETKDLEAAQETQPAQ